MTVQLSAAEIAGMRDDLEAVELSMSCTIQRLTAGQQTDQYGNPIMAWANLATAVPCWYWEDSQSEIVGPTINATVTTSRVKFAAGQDITTADRIANLVDRDGVTHTGPFAVLAVVDRLTALVATVEAIS